LQAGGHRFDPVHLHQRAPPPAGTAGGGGDDGRRFWGVWARRSFSGPRERAGVVLFFRVKRELTSDRGGPSGRAREACRGVRGRVFMEWGRALAPGGSLPCRRRRRGWPLRAAVMSGPADRVSGVAGPGSAREGHLVDALALRGEEGRGTLRKARGRCERSVIPGSPNGATHPWARPAGIPRRIDRRGRRTRRTETSQ
jgi:hypothetical protein